MNTLSELTPLPVRQAQREQRQKHKHATGCAYDGHSGCRAASGHGFAKVHLPLFYGPLYSSASAMVVCSLALL